METIRVFRDSRGPQFQDLGGPCECFKSDWFGRQLKQKSSFLFWVDKKRFHFLAEAHFGPGIAHPESRAGEFTPELWKYDVSEFFLSDPSSGRYLEFNLAPNGAWWSCGFSGPRQPATGEPSAIPGVRTASRQESNFWQVHASLPLQWLEDHYHWGEASRLNATMIVNSPDQLFLTAGPSQSGAPDFHRPDAFPRVKFIALA